MRKCLCLFFAVFLLLVFCSTASAAMWDFEAISSNHSTISDFTIRFDDADNDNVVALSDVVYFSGVWDSLTSYEQLIDLRATSAGGLTLVATDLGYPTRWHFYDAELGADKYLTLSDTNTLLSYNASVVPIPGAVWLLGSGLVGLMGFRKKFRAA